MNLPHKTRLLVTVLLICISIKTNAQKTALRFEHIGVEQGLSSNAVTCILQDREGYIWIGTEDGGLNKYDGYSFTRYTFDPLDSNSLSQNLIYTIWEDKEGYIWASTYEGLCKFDRNTEKFTRYKPDPGSKFSDPNILSINEDDNGTMWIGGASGQLCRFNKQTGKFYDERFDLGFRKGPGEVHDGINSLYKDREGTLWVGNYTGLHKLIIQPAKPGERSQVNIIDYRPNPRDTNSLSSKIVKGIFEDHAGILWILTDSGLNSFDRKTGQFKRYLPDPKNIYSISGNISGFWGNEGLAEDREGNLWISTDKGLNELNPGRTRFYTYNHESSDPNSINGDISTVVFIDRSDILWVGSSSLWAGSSIGGLNKASLIQKPFGLKRHDPANNNSLSDNNVTSLLEDSSGAVWIGTHGGGLNRWDKKTDEFTCYRHEEKDPATLRHNYVYAMLQDHEGDLWVCNGDVLSLLNRRAGGFIHYNSNAANYTDFDHLAILSMTQDREGLIWLGTGSGIKSFDKKTRTFTHYYHDPANPSGISDYTAQAIFADSRNNIWVGYGSIATDRLDKKTGRITHYKHDPRDPSSISSNIVNSFYEDSKGNLWLATFGGGLCRFAYSTGKFTTYTDKDGLPDNTVFSILEDKKNDLWLGTRNGLACFDPVKKTCTNYDYDDGLQGNYFAAGHRSRPASCSGGDGILYFGGDNGFNFFDPSQVTAGKALAPVVITQFKLFDKLVKGANEAKQITLKYNQNYFSFEFASLSFYNPEKNQYAYKLEGVDKDWVYSGSRRYAGYTDIGPGKHIFRVKATNNEGVWNEEGASVLVIIQPPWWRTWWAYCLYGLLLVSAAIAVHRYQKQKVIRAEREKAQKKELAQAKEIEKAYHQLKETQAQLIQSEKMASLGELTAGIAHEIQNPLNFVNNFSEVNKELLEELEGERSKVRSERDEQLENDIIKGLKENEEKINHHGKRADAIVKGMLQHSRKSEGIKEPTNINALCDECLRLSFHGLRAKDKSFNAEFKTDFDNSIGKINVAPQDIGRVLLNLFNNAFYAVNEKQKAKSSSYVPKVTVVTKKLNDKIEIRVVDNGTGIPQNIVDKIFQPFFTTKPTGQGTGLGLSLAYDIIKAHGGEIKVETKENEGSEFTIQLPV
jgi:ligand-binding sensor domain-containing protein/signal transduction histidine kinase